MVLVILSRELLNYGHRTDEGFFEWPDPQTVRSNLVNFELTDERHPKLHALLQLVQGPGAWPDKVDDNDLVSFEVDWKS